MIEKIQQGNEIILKLVRKDRFWVCSECEKEYRGEVPTQCSCGAQDKVFTEKDSLVEEGPRKLYKVMQNFIYSSQHIAKGSIVSLLIKDRVTKGLLERKLIQECEEKVSKKEVAKEKVGSVE